IKDEQEDSQEAFPDTVLYHASGGGDQAEPCLRRFSYREQVRSTRQVQRDYTFTHPAYRLEQVGLPDHIQHLANDYERFDYPGRYKREAVAKPLIHTRAMGLRHDARLAEVEGDDVRLQPGLSFSLTEHPRETFNVHWRVIRVSHTGTQFASLQEEAADAQQGTHYSQTAVVVPGLTEWRPEPLPKPHVDGPHMATVVGPPGEEIYCDQWGRVKVSFPWDRESRDNEFSSCWVRVSQGWAGGSWGSMAIPRIGQDVIIQYVNADPDQPMITGRTYCGNQLPPYDLPEHKTRMTIKSQTHKGDGFNELRFEDELGRQEVFIHAERDQNNVVKHDETTRVGNDRSERVEHNETLSIGDHRSEDVGKNETIRIGENRSVTIGANKTETVILAKTETIGLAKALTIGAGYQTSVGAAMNTSVGLSQSEQVGINKSVVVGKHFHVTAGDEFTLTVGKSSLVMKSDGSVLINGSTLDLSATGPVQINGKDVDIN
ncbi:type VI secretion system tip protein VgrG, partial [Pseudomonas alkylphenolica]